MNAPFVAAAGASVGRVAVGCKITRDKIGLATVLVSKGDIETIVQKRIGFGRFTRFRSIECQRDLVPFLELSTDLPG